MADAVRVKGTSTSAGHVLEVIVIDDLHFGGSVFIGGLEHTLSTGIDDAEFKRELDIDEAMILWRSLGEWLVDVGRVQHGGGSWVER